MWKRRLKHSTAEFQSIQQFWLQLDIVSQQTKRKLKMLTHGSETRLFWGPKVYKGYRRAEHRRMIIYVRVFFFRNLLFEWSTDWIFQGLSLYNFDHRHWLMWPSGLAYRTQVLVLAAECGFESRPWHLCPWARHLTIIASLHLGVKWVPVRVGWYGCNGCNGCNGSNWAVYSPGSWDGFRNDLWALWALWAGVIMRLEHHLVGGYVRYISPYIIILLLLIATRHVRMTRSITKLSRRRNVNSEVTGLIPSSINFTSVVDVCTE